MNSGHRAMLWRAVNDYVESCGGDPSDQTVSERRMALVSNLERLVDDFIDDAKHPQAHVTETPTYAALLTFLGTLTPEQLAQKVRWMGEERGGDLKAAWVAAEDHYSAGYGLEPVSVLQKTAKEEEPGTPLEKWLEEGDYTKLAPVGTVMLLDD